MTIHLRNLALFLCLALAGCTSKCRPDETSARAPATRVEPVTETRNGVAVVDNYRWLEGDNSDPNAQGKTTAEVAAWTDAQNRYTRDVLDRLPGRERLEAQFRPLLKTGVVTAPIMRANRYFYSARTAAQDQ